MEEEYKIIADTNFICHNKEEKLLEVLNFKIFEIKEFIEKNKIAGVEICIPEIVFYETIQRRLDIVDGIITRIDENFKKIKELGIVQGNQVYKRENYEKRLNKEFKEIIKKNRFTIIKRPMIKFKVLEERALKKIPPFSDQDRGLKDTLIWFSILEYARKNKGANFIFLTQNVDHFKDEKLEKEFREYSKKKIRIISEITDLKEFFDSELRLKLELKELHKKIEDGIREDIGRIMMELHSRKYSYKEYPGKRFFERFLEPTFSIVDIKKINKSLYEVNLTLQTKGRVGEAKKDGFLGVTDTSSLLRGTTSIIGDSLYPMFSSEEYREAIFEIRLFYSPEKGKIDQINYMNPSYPVIEEMDFSRKWL